MHGNQFTIDNNDNVVPHIVDKPMTIQAAQRQINAILAGCTTASSITEFTNQAKLEYDAFFAPTKTTDRTVQPSSAPMYTKNDDHDAFLCHRWNKANTNKATITPSTTKPTPAAATPTYQKSYAPTEIPVKDDPSVTPTLETLCTHNTCSLHQTNIDTNVILNITLWNQPIVQYQMPIQLFAYTYTHNRF